MKFTQYEVESELSDAVPNGIKNDIARDTGIYPSVVTGWFNRDDERKSPQYQVLQMQAALDALNPEIGERHWQTLERLREASKPSTGALLCVHTETAKTNKETSELLCAVLTSAPLYDQLKEALDHRNQAERLVQAILEAINIEKEESAARTRFPGKAVSTSTHSAVRAKMRGV